MTARFNKPQENRPSINGGLTTNIWVETKREYDVDANGDQVLTSVTKELDDRRSKLLDRVLRILGGLAIFIPLYLFYLQRERESESNKAKLQVESYTGFNLYFNQLMTTEVGSPEFKTAHDRFSEQIPRITFISEMPILRQVDTMQTQLFYLTFIDETTRLADSVNDAIYNFFQNIDNQIEKQKYRHFYLINLGRLATKMNSLESLLAADNVLQSPSSVHINKAFKFIKDSIWTPNQTGHDSAHIYEFTNLMQSRIDSLKKNTNNIRGDLVHENADLYTNMIRSTKF